jgi:DNA repair protein RadC
MIDLRPPAPWRAEAFTEIDIEPDREKAKDKAMSRRISDGISVFSDTSGKSNCLGAAAVALDQDQKIIASRQVSIGSMEHWSVYAAELMAIFYAISLVYQIAQQRPATVDW